MPNEFKKLRKQMAESKLYEDLSAKTLSNLGESGEVTRFSSGPNLGLANDYDTSDAYKKLLQIREQISSPNAPSQYSEHRNLLRQANKSTLPDLLNRSQMMNPLEDEAQRKAVSNDLINRRASTGKIYDFPEIQNNPAIRHSENDFIDKIARGRAAKKMEQDAAQKVISSFLNAKQGALGVLKKTGALGLKALPFVGAAADIAMTPEIGQDSDKPIGPQLTHEDFEDLYKKR